MASKGNENIPDKLYYSIMTDASIDTDHLLNSLTETTAGSELVTEAESELIGYSIYSTGSSASEDKVAEKKVFPCALMLCAGVHPYDCKSAGVYIESPKLSARNHSFTSTYKEIVNNSHLLPNTRKKAALRNPNDDEYGLPAQNQLQQHSKNSDSTRPHKNHAKETYAILDILDDEDEETEDDSTIGSDDQIPQTIVTAYSSLSIQNGNEDAINSNANFSKRYKPPYHDEKNEDSSKSSLPPVTNIKEGKPLPSKSSTAFTITEDEQYQSLSSTSTSISTHNEDKMLLNSPQSNPVISNRESTEIPPSQSSNNMLAMEDEEVETNVSSNKQLVLFNEPEEDTHNTQSIDEQLSTGDEVKDEEPITNTADQYKTSNPTEMCTEEESKKVPPSSSLVLREKELEVHPDIITFKKRESCTPMLVPEISNDISPVLMSTVPEARRETFTGVFNGICSQKINDALTYMMKMAESTPNTNCYENEECKQISIQSVLQRTTCPQAIPTDKMAMRTPDIGSNERRSVVETIEIEFQSPKSQHTFQQLSSLKKTPGDKKWESVNIITISSSTETDGSKKAQGKQASNATTEIEVTTPALKDLKDGDASVGSKKSRTSFISALSIGSQQWNKKYAKPKQQQGAPLHHSLSSSIATSKGKSRKFSSSASASDKSSLPISTRSLPAKLSTITKSAHTSNLFTITSGTREDTCSTSSTLFTASSGSDAAVQLDTDSYTRSTTTTHQEETQPSHNQDGLLLTDDDNNNEVGASNDTVPTGTASRPSTKVPIVVLQRGIKPRRSSSDSTTSTSTSARSAGRTGGVPKLKRTTAKTTKSGRTVKSTGSDLNHQKRLVKKNPQEGDGASSAQPKRHKFVMNLGIKVRELQQLEEEAEGNSNNSNNIKSKNIFKRGDKRRRWNAITTVRRRRIRTEDVVSDDLVLSTTEEDEDFPTPITTGSF